MQKDPFENSPAWLNAVGAITVAVIGVSIAFIAGGGWDNYLNFLGNSGPAWVQAVGSILAIWVALEVMNSQRKEQRDRDVETARRHRVQRLEVCQTITAMANAVCEVMVERMPNMNEGLGTFGDGLQGCLLQFDQMPILEIPEPLLIRRFVGLRQQIDFLRDSVQELHATPNDKHQRMATVKAARHALAVCNACSSYCNVLLHQSLTAEERAARRAANASYDKEIARAKSAVGVVD